jgi:F-type H+-transporting ATPase subunit a
MLLQTTSLHELIQVNMNPLDQFEIRDFINLNSSFLGNMQLSLTNIAMYLIIASMVSFYFHIFTDNNFTLLSSKWSISTETIYDTINNIVVNQINKTKGQRYFPFMYVLFIFILVNNLIGITPYSFASTSHFILTFSLSFSIVLGATILGLQIHTFKFFSLFVPAGCPLALLPLLVLIEFISYLARNVSLGLRLAANILSGHMLLNILSGFTYNIMTSNILYFFIGLLPLTFIIAFAGLELAIAFIQAQVFVVLSSSYIKDALDLH